MKKIVIVSKKEEDKRGLVAVLSALFPECEIQIVQPRCGLKKDNGDNCLPRVNYMIKKNPYNEECAL